MEWSWKKKKRNIENKSSTKVSDHQTTSTKAAIIKTRPRRDFSSIWLLFVRGFLVEGILRSDTYYTSILPIVSFSFLFNYLRENIRTGINAGDHHHVHRSSFRTCLRAPSFFLFYFLFLLFFELAEVKDLSLRRAPIVTQPRKDPTAKWYRTQQQQQQQQPANYYRHSSRGQERERNWKEKNRLTVVGLRQTCRVSHFKFAYYRTVIQFRESHRELYTCKWPRTI